MNLYVNMQLKKITIIFLMRLSKGSVYNWFLSCRHCNLLFLHVTLSSVTPHLSLSVRTRNNPKSPKAQNRPSHPPPKKTNRPIRPLSPSPPLPKPLFRYPNEFQSPAWRTGRRRTPWTHPWTRGIPTISIKSIANGKIPFLNTYRR